MVKTLLFSLTTFLLVAWGHATGPLHASEAICGKWMSADKDLMIHVYKEGNEYRAKILWFDDHDDSMEMDDYLDKHNPDPTLRSRKILGMNVLEKLIYSPNTNTWEDGIIYDAQRGRRWTSCAYLTKDGLLKVKGY